MPFEIPDSWTWIRLSAFCDIYTGDSISKTDKEKIYRQVKNGLDYIGTKDVNFDHSINYDNGVRIPVGSDFRRCPKSKILLCIEGGSAGRKIGITTKEVCFGNKLACFNSWINNEKFLFLFLQSPLFLQLFKSNLTGIISGVSISNLKRLLMPLPPLNEQKRIADKYSSLEKDINTYESIETALTILESSFETRFKASILQYAIEGKLVKQDPNDEPASVLLERIKAEKNRLIKEGKIKPDKHNSEIVPADDKDYYRAIETGTADYSFNIPGCWRIVRLGSLFSHNTGKALNQKEKDGMLKEYITTSNVYWNRFVLLNLKKMYFKEKELDKCTVHQGDLLVCEGGDIGRSAIWKEPYDICIQNHIHRLRPYIPEVCQEFYLYVLWLYKYTGAIGGKGIGIQGLSSNALDALMLPLPPYNEQKRIIAKINSLSQVI